MKLIIEYYKFFNEYKARVTLMKDRGVSFVELIVLYSIFSKKRTQREIVDFLQKDRSQIYRVLKKLVEKKLVIKKENEYVITSLGAEVSKNLIEENEKILNILNNKVDLKSLQEKIKEASLAISN
ncbi:hypothetical protein PM10SUCC1_29230 [Propionigenium maris DSM 9537]|uniref:HTH marR-type domain-containing protein n=1 Tax=Propionigenium maris DSM 9537 TaxID=1123000 RepID=A0A9W6LNY1_9FUSO|nr:helix-turn-helix domain-containing protein [Propionigenium maris]GLI57409.1 hypothetical protein PM10SUCC1_29230 [Propionigenium maris DSM 9537]